MEYTAPLHTVGWERPVTNCFNFSTWWKNSIGLISKTSETCFKILSANSGLTRKACWGWRILSTTKWYWSCYAMSSSPLPTSHSACYLWLLDHAWQPHLYIRHHPFNCTYETYFTESAATSSLVEIRGLRWGRTGCGGGRLLLPVKWISNGAWCIRIGVLVNLGLVKVTLWSL